jgi:signal transduction histidine kinase
MRLLADATRAPDGTLEPPIAGDATSLRELLTNLVLNAVDALPAGGGD